MPPKKETPTENQPKAVKPNKEANLNELGLREHTTHKDIPKTKMVEVDKNTGQKRQFFDMDAGDVEVRENLLQPFLTEEEVEALGVFKWHAYRGDPNIMTTVVNGRRFKLDRKTFESLKNRQLAEQDG